MGLLSFLNDVHAALVFLAAAPEEDQWTVFTDCMAFFAAAASC